VFGGLGGWVTKKKKKNRGGVVFILWGRGLECGKVRENNRVHAGEMGPLLTLILKTNEKGTSKTEKKNLNIKEGQTAFVVKII